MVKRRAGRQDCHVLGPTYRVTIGDDYSTPGLTPLRLPTCSRAQPPPSYLNAHARADISAVPLLLHDINPLPVPVPLHGDLWPGNVAGGTIYDPAGYYGHGEADLGMTRMFGGEWVWRSDAVLVVVLGWPSRGERREALSACDGESP